jgi:hypothetical protein
MDEPLVCTCKVPIPMHIALFDAWQCNRCLRAILPLSHPRERMSTHE